LLGAGGSHPEGWRSRRRTGRWGVGFGRGAGCALCPPKVLAKGAGTFSTFSRAPEAVRAHRQTVRNASAKKRTAEGAGTIGGGRGFSSAAKNAELAYNLEMESV